MRFGIDDTKYIARIIESIIEAIFEQQHQGQLCPQTTKQLELDLSYLKEVIKNNPK